MQTLGLLEYVLIRRESGGKWKRFKAKLDTRAVWSRIGVNEASKLRLGPIIGVCKIRTGSGRETRALVPAKVRIGGHQIAVRFSVSTRRDGVLIGKRTIGKRFRVSSSQKYLSDLDCRRSKD